MKFEIKPRDSNWENIDSKPIVDAIFREFMERVNNIDSVFTKDTNNFVLS